MNPENCTGRQASTDILVSDWRSAAGGAVYER